MIVKFLITGSGKDENKSKKKNHYYRDVIKLKTRLHALSHLSMMFLLKIGLPSTSMIIREYRMYKRAENFEAAILPAEIIHFYDIIYPKVIVNFPCLFSFLFMC